MSVYANGREVSGKATPNKTIASFPDVCMSPPSPPAGPVPLPYPVTSMASKTSDGTRSVKIKRKEIGKKNSSNYTKCDGNQPATKSFGAGVISHQLTGKTRFQAYSFDVMLEKGGAERFMDLTTSNHINTQNTNAGINTAKAAAATPIGEQQCAKLKQANKETRAELASREKPDGTDHSTSTKVSEKATITHGVFTPTGGSSSHVRACSNKLASNYINGMAEGLSANLEEGENPRKSKACDGSFEYKKGTTDGRPHTSHTEARIIEDLFNPTKSPSAAGGGTLVMHIDWKTARGKHSRQDACKHCRQLLCHVSSGDPPCIDIKVCHGNPKAKPKTPQDLGYCK